MQQMPKEMSKGMIDKLQICLVMSRNARLYLLDEPIGGVDIEASAIEDAKHNAELNGITNCEFICSPAEKVMSELLRSEEAKSGSARMG